KQKSDLRERWFGNLDGMPDANYHRTWAFDAVSPSHQEDNVEPVTAVAARTSGLVERARREVDIRQSAVILVSHGDTLQILQCWLAGRPLGEHRSLPPLENCGVRVLRP
ncbi:unnamed protein product, partial [Discosporangium mesarthrocarpum]